MLRLRYVVNGEERATPLTGGRVRLGRGSDNDVVLSDVSVSRYHAEILREADGWSVHDLKSTNGVDVNRVPVEKAPLRPGDLLTIGAFEIRLEEEEPRPVRSVAPEVGEGTLAGLGNATIIRPLADFAAAYGLAGSPARPPSAAIPQTETSDQIYVHRMFGFLTRLARMLTVAESVDDVLSRVFDLAFEAFPVDRGFILLADESGELVCELARIKKKSQFRPAGEVPVSRTMLQTVMEERVALVTFDAQADQRLSGGESIRLHQIRSPDQSGAHIAERIWCRRIDSPPDSRWSAWASKVTSATRSSITAWSMVRETGTSPVGWSCDLSLIRASSQTSSPVSSERRMNPRSTGEASKARSSTRESTSSTESAMVSMRARRVRKPNIRWT